MTSTGIAVMITVLQGLAIAPNHATSTRYVAFGPHGSDWLLVEVASRRVERITLPAKDVVGLAVSSDGTRFAYVGPAGNSKGVWSWKRHDPAPRLVESGAGRYSDPAIAPDGWIYFSRSPVNGSRHTFGTYAQVFRIRPDGTGLQQITNEKGCHFGVTFTRRGELQYIHSSCTAQSWIERIGPSTNPETLVAVAGSLAEATTSPDGRSILFVSDEPDSFVVHETAGRNPPRVVFALDRRMSRVRIAYGRNSDEILYQQGGKVWVLNHGVSTMLAALEREALQ